MANEQPCFTVVQDDGSEVPSSQELRSALEKGSDEVKIDTLRKIIISTLNGNDQPAALMPIIQFVLPSKNKQLKKLLHFYWEVCRKKDDQGKLKQEMILVCNAIRNDLQHPNEYIRGATLRFLQKIKEPELLEPLVPTCLKYDAATTLTTLTQNPAAVKAAATAFAELVAKESDNNVKLIALDRIETLHSKHEHVLDNLAMDILGVLTSTDMEVRRKAVKISLSMVTSRNVQDVVLFLKKQLTKTLEQEYEKNVEYRQLLIQSIHVCAIRFSEVAASVVHAMMEFLGDSSNSAAVDVIAFVREVVEKFPNLRQSIIEKLLATFPDIKSGKVYRGALWIVGEYCAQPSDIEDAFVQIRKVIGEIPILAAEQRLLDAAGGDVQPEEPLVKTGGAPKVLEDGTYAAETALSSAAAARLEAVKKASKPPLR
ncbi:coatomer subunit beta, partial [Serendipita sp. 411]